MFISCTVHSDCIKLRKTHITDNIEVSDVCLSHAQSIQIALRETHITDNIEVRDMCLSHAQSIQIALIEGH